MITETNRRPHGASPRRPHGGGLEEKTVCRARRLRRATGAILGLALVCSLSLPHGEALGAEGIDLEHGTWRITQFTPKPFYGQPPAKVVSTCISGDNPDPLDVLVVEPCEVQSTRIDGNRLTWKYACEHPASGERPFLGKGHLIAEGSTFKGKTTVRLEILENIFVVQHDLSGRRAGPCPR